jgi:hypothetical protein
VSSVLAFLFLLASFGCFAIAAFGVRARWAARVNLIALGLALYIFIDLVDVLTELD